MGDFDSPERGTQIQGDRVTMDVFVNKLVIVRPVEFTDTMKTEFKPDGAEAVFANIACLEPIDGEPWKIYKHVLVMQGWLVGDFKRSLRKNLLGTIYLGERKSGQKPPYKFQDLAQNEKALAVASPWLKANRAEFEKELQPDFADVNDKPTADSSRQAVNDNPWLSEEPPF